MSDGRGAVERSVLTIESCVSSLGDVGKVLISMGGGDLRTGGCSECLAAMSSILPDRVHAAEPSWW